MNFEEHANVNVKTLIEQTSFRIGTPILVQVNRRAIGLDEFTIAIEPFLSSSLVFRLIFSMKNSLF